MKTSFQSVFKDKTIASLNRIATHFKETNMSPEEIAEEIEGLCEITKAGIHIAILESNDHETAERFSKAMNILKEKRINSFKKAIESGKEAEFFSTMSFNDKISLKSEIELASIIKLNIEMTPEEIKAYRDIIQKYINADVEKEALSKGFSSVDEWRKHNARASQQNNIQINTGHYQKMWNYGQLKR